MQTVEIGNIYHFSGLGKTKSISYRSSMQFLGLTLERNIKIRLF